MSKIYTRSGDEGMTSLGNGERAAKDSLRIEVHGAVDELNSLLGLVIAEGTEPEIQNFLLSVQNDLFILGAELAFPKNEKSSIPGIDAGRIELLEKEIDLLSANLPVLHNFILPGGTKSAALLHLSRTFCRRAERLAVSLSRQTEIDPLILMYLNRLSDVLFTTARYQNHLEHQPETIWTNPQKKP